MPLEWLLASLFIFPMFDILVDKSGTGRRVGRIPYVESASWDPTQLFRIGFAVNFYMESILSGIYGFGTV